MEGCSPPPAVGPVELTSTQAPPRTPPSHRAGVRWAHVAVCTVRGPAQGPPPLLGSCLGFEAGLAPLPAGAPLGCRHAHGTCEDPFRMEQQGPDGVCFSLRPTSGRPPPVSTARTHRHRVSRGRRGWPACGGQRPCPCYLTAGLQASVCRQPGDCGCSQVSRP